jgi:hypothetical protein
VRIERVALKDHCQVARLRRHAGHIGAADDNASGCGGFEAGNQPQQRALATAGWTYQHEKFTVIDVKVDLSDRDMPIREGLRNSLEPDGGHAFSPCSRLPSDRRRSAADR